MIPRNRPFAVAILTLGLALPGLAPAEDAEGDAALDAAIQHHLAQSAEPAPMPGAEMPGKAKKADPTSSADAMVNHLIEDVPEDLTVAARRPHVDLDIKFDFDSSELSGDGIEQLDTAGEALNDPRLAGRRFMLSGHTDDRGEETYNRALSLRRAQSAREYLIEKHHVDPERLETAGFGSEKPKIEDKTPEARRRNRRVVLEMIE